MSFLANRPVCAGQRLFSAVMTALVMLSVIAVARAQQPPPKQWKLANIEAPNLHRFNQEQILGFSGLQLGQTIDLDGVKEAMTRINQTGYFTKVSYRYHYVDDQLTVTFELEEAKWNVPVIFDNFVWFSDDELIGAVRQAVPGFDGTAPSAGDTIATITSALDQLLKEKHLPGMIEYVPIIERTGEESGHVFGVRGVLMPICALRFTGMAAVSESDLQKKSKALIKSEYSRSFVADFARSNLIPVYRERGYLKARFSDAQAARGEGDCKNGVQVTLSVTEGAVYSWEKAEWSGNSALTTLMLEDMLAMKAGELANGLKIDEGFKKIKIVYGNKGYITSKLGPVLAFDDANTRVAYRIAVAEGPQYHMGSVTFTGISESEAARLRKAWKLKEGAVYNASYLDDFRTVWLPPTEPTGAKLKNVSAKLDQQQLTVNLTFSFK